MSTDTPHYAGHRARLRERLLKDSTALADYEILELLLGYALLRRDTKPLAKELLSRFGSIRGVLDALPAEMQQVGGVGEGVAALRLLLREMMARYAEAPMRERKVLCTPRDVAQMVIPRLSGSPHEELWTATVDAQNRLLTWERLARGTVGMVPCYPRDILERVLQRKASGFFLVHNHPGGTPKASPEDIEMTRNIQRIATSMGLRLLDHPGRRRRRLLQHTRGRTALNHGFSTVLPFEDTAMTFDSDNDNDEKKEETPARRRRRPARRRVPAQIQDEQMDASEDVTPELQEIPSTMPLLPLRDVVVFNYTIVPLFVGREQSVQAVEAAATHGRHIFLCAQKDGQVDETPKRRFTWSAPALLSCVCSRCPTGASRRWCRGYRAPASST